MWLAEEGGRRRTCWKKEQIAWDLGAPGIKLLIFTVSNIEMI